VIVAYIFVDAKKNVCGYIHQLLTTSNKTSYRSTAWNKPLL